MCYVPITAFNLSDKDFFSPSLLGYSCAFLKESPNPVSLFWRGHLQHYFSIAFIFIVREVKYFKFITSLLNSHLISLAPPNYQTDITL